jgi:hypothetical protein
MSNEAARERRVCIYICEIFPQSPDIIWAFIKTSVVSKFDFLSEEYTAHDGND